MSIKKAVLIVVLVLATLLQACGVPDLYNEGQTLYVNATKGYSDFVLCQTIENQNIEQTFKLYYGGLWADIQQKKEYRAAMNAAAQAASSAPKATTTDGNEVIDFNKLPETATPNGVYSGGLSFSVYAIQEAQIIPIAPEMFTKALDAVQVANNHKFQCGQTWNTTVAEYNTWRRKVSGRILGDLAEYFGIEEMPKELPMFSVPAFQPGAAPNTDGNNPFAPTPVK